jgi:hypothetical protein
MATPRHSDSSLARHYLTAGVAAQPQTQCPTERSMTAQASIARGRSIAKGSRPVGASNVTSADWRRSGWLWRSSATSPLTWAVAN